MANDSLSVYLNDHLAGARFALDLIEHCRSKLATGEVAESLRQLQSEIKEDQVTLKEIMSTLGAEESLVKKTGAWLAEKFGHLSVSVGRSEVSFARLQELEALLAGVVGKRALWEVLETISSGDPGLAAVDWRELKRRATEQYQRIDALRIDAACEAFRSDTRHLE